ncbi:Protein of unknown function [Pyronema omphalodes CBS 100304]|uniref:Uncharacterized protein n=1 Tax=Pyronema omphalodes (strain CBS 100304) TaxID=1076935 RepID=U4LAZ1_PYROM|nr:Protein of unknown function [Pyronema omphalodes CBS 100304]
MKALKSDPGTKISSVETKISSVEVKPSKKIDGCGKEEVDLLKAESQKQATRMERLETKIEKVDLKTGRLSVALWLYAAITAVLNSRSNENDRQTEKNNRSETPAASSSQVSWDESEPERQPEEPLAKKKRGGKPKVQ